MKKISVPQAEGINLSEIKVRPGSSCVNFVGARPTYKRQRSFWRAFRRGECWAVMDYATREMIRDINRELYDNAIVQPYSMTGLLYFLRGKSNE